MSAKSNNHTVPDVDPKEEIFRSDVAASSTLHWSRNILNNLLGAAAASTLSSLARAILLISTTRALRLICASNRLHFCLGARIAGALARSATTDISLSTTAASSLVRTGNFLDIRLVAIGTGTVAGRTWTSLGLRTTIALTLLGTWDSRDAALLLLEICQTTGLGVDVLNLAGALGVEVDELLSSGCTSGLLVVGSQSGE